MIRILEANEFSEDASSQVNVLDQVKRIFAKDGDLEKTLGFEFRAEQAEMAQAYARSLTAGKHLIFEAGTGVGKSLAYLIPSILYSRLHRRKCVVATNTINLQEQLLEKDLPTVRDLFIRAEGLEIMADFTCALLVGRANYLCQNRLNKALMGGWTCLRPISEMSYNELQSGWQLVQGKVFGKSFFPVQTLWSGT